MICQKQKIPLVKTNLELLFVPQKTLRMMIKGAAALRLPVQSPLRTFKVSQCSDWFWSYVAQ